jgi:hypothetical protein
MMIFKIAFNPVLLGNGHSVVVVVLVLVLIVVVVVVVEDDDDVVVVAVVELDEQLLTGSKNANLLKF